MLKFTYGETMLIKCNDYETKDIIKFMRDSTDKTQTKFAQDINKTRSWTAKAERDEINIYLNDFLELAKKNKIDIIMRKRDE